MGWILSLEPSDLVDLLLNLQTLQVVELRLMALERAVHIVLSSFRDGSLGLEAENRQSGDTKGSLCVQRKLPKDLAGK